GLRPPGTGDQNSSSSHSTGVPRDVCFRTFVAGGGTDFEGGSPTRGPVSRFSCLPNSLQNIVSVLRKTDGSPTDLGLADMARGSRRRSAATLTSSLSHFHPGPAQPSP